MNKTFQVGPEALCQTHALGCAEMIGLTDGLKVCRPKPKVHWWRITLKVG
jgi:hypothetical protein